MKDQRRGFTSTELTASASQILSEGGYKQIRMFSGWDTATSRLFEDKYNVVGVVVFETCGELIKVWPDLQGSLVDVISKHVSRVESKSWDGYLVLFTRGLAPSEKDEIQAIRYDTSRLRKLVATGDDLASTSDVTRVLSSLLPFGKKRTKVTGESVLDLLPELLEEKGISKDTTKILIEAFRKQAPLLERLYQKAVQL